MVFHNIVKILPRLSSMSRQYISGEMIKINYMKRPQATVPSSQFSFWTKHYAFDVGFFEWCPLIVWSDTMLHCLHIYIQVLPVRVSLQVMVTTLYLHNAVPLLFLAMLMRSRLVDKSLNLSPTLAILSRDCWSSGDYSLSPCMQPH